MDKKTRIGLHILALVIAAISLALLASIGWQAVIGVFLFAWALRISDAASKG